MSEKLKPISPKFGDKLIYQHTNMWGDWSQNIFEYTYAGSSGSYPEYKHRFTRCGDSRISKDGMMDIFIRSEEMHVGEQGEGCLGRIKEYTPASESAAGDVDRIEAELMNFAIDYNRSSGITGAGYKNYPDLAVKVYHWLRAHGHLNTKEQK